MDCDKKYIHELLVQLKHNNDEAAAPLLECLSYVFYQKAVGSYELSHEDAQDAIQQTFFRIIDGRIDTYDELKGGGPAWMWRIFYHVVVDMMRKQQSRQRKDVSLDELLEKAQNDILALEDSEAMNPVPPVERDEEKEALQKSWDALTEAERKAIIRGRGPGDGRNEYWAASKHVRALYEKYYGPIQQS
jgi:RNA polymerase sigma factor (sigma-70 family)